MALLDGFGPADRRRPTAAPGWSAFEVAAHLLGDDLGRLARRRDRASGTGPRPDEPFPRFIDRINDEWVVAATRLRAMLSSGVRLTSATSSSRIAALEPR